MDEDFIRAEVKRIVSGAEAPSAIAGRPFPPIEKGGLAALEENLLKMQEVLQNDTRNLADVMEVLGQGQIEFEGKLEREIRGLVNSVGVIEQNQAKLRKQVEEVRSSTQAIVSDLTVSLEQLNRRASNAGSAPPPESEEARTPPPEATEEE